MRDQQEIISLQQNKAVQQKRIFAQLQGEEKCGDSYKCVLCLSPSLPCITVEGANTEKCTNLVGTLGDVFHFQSLKN